MHMQFKIVRALFTLGSSATLLRAGASPRPARWPAVWRRLVQRRRKAAWRAWPGAPMELRLTCRSIVHWGAGASPRVGAAAAQVVRLTRAADAAALERCLGTHGLLGVFVDATLACRAAALVRTRARCARTAGNLASCVASRGAACWKLLCLEQACRVRTGHITRQCGVGADRAAACTPPACGVLARVSSAQGA